MTERLRPLAFAAAVILLLPLAGMVRADDIPAPPPEIADLVQTCTACHGTDGKPTLEAAPIIWGQNEYYIYIELKDFKSGLRANSNDTMKPIADSLDRETMKKLAAYFSKLPWPRLGYVTPEADVPIGEDLAVAGQCSQCHLANWEGNSRVPRLGGQNVNYLLKQMFDFKHKVRMNAPDIAALFTDLTDDQVTAMAHYVAGR